MTNPKITMMSYWDGKIGGKVVINGHEWVVKPFKVELGISAIEIENKLIERAISVKREAADKQESKLMDWVKG